MPRAQFDLANVSVGPVNLLGDQRRALLASPDLAFRDLAAAIDVEGFRRGIEIGLQHTMPGADVTLPC